MTRKFILMFGNIILLATTTFAAGLEVPESAELVRPLLVGTTIPDVTVKDLNGKPFALRSEIKKMPAVIIFYRGGWCPYCNIQLGELKKIEGDLMALGYQILAISADRLEEVKKTEVKNKPKYTLISDSMMAAAKAFGIAFRVNAETIEKYKGFGINLEKASGESHHILPVPSVFLVGKDGEIKFEYVNPNYKVRLNNQILLAAAKAFSE